MMIYPLLVSQETGSGPPRGLSPHPALHIVLLVPVTPLVNTMSPFDQIPLWREIFHASSMSHTNQNGNADLHVYCHTCIPQWLHRHEPQIYQNANVLDASRPFCLQHTDFWSLFQKVPNGYMWCTAPPLFTRCCVDVAKATLVLPVEFD